jgi:NAD(P)-dependent dehydrogenase (short-subunit alcohol dehydrogenase family)
MRLQNKLALITGSSRGIGQQIALGLAGEGCDLIIHGRKQENTARTVELLKAYQVKVDTVSGELTSEESVRSIIAQVLAKHDGIDILYNNAAIMNAWKPLWEITPDEWRAVFQVNLYAMVMLCNAFAPGMRERGYGRIVNLTSGIKDTPNLTPYSVSKAAVDKYTMDLAAELRGTGVLVNRLDPGWLKTDLGGPNADHEVATVLPGALVPALLDKDGPSGEFFSAQEYRRKSV